MALAKAAEERSAEEEFFENADDRCGKGGVSQVMKPAGGFGFKIQSAGFKTGEKCGEERQGNERPTKAVEAFEAMA